MRDIFIQLIIGLTGGAAIGCLASLKPWRRWGYIIGMLGQPCWFYVTYENEQWAMLALAGWYTWVYFKGILDHWIIGSQPLLSTIQTIHGSGQGTPLKDWEFTPDQLEGLDLEYFHAAPELLPEPDEGTEGY